MVSMGCIFGSAPTTFGDLNSKSKTYASRTFEDVVNGLLIGGKGYAGFQHRPATATHYGARWRSRTPLPEQDLAHDVGTGRPASPASSAAAQRVDARRYMAEPSTPR